VRTFQFDDDINHAWKAEDVISFVDTGELAIAAVIVNLVDFPPARVEEGGCYPLFLNIDRCCRA
jgi:hypothetical protein